MGSPAITQSMHAQIVVLADDVYVYVGAPRSVLDD